MSTPPPEPFTCIEVTFPALKLSKQRHLPRKRNSHKPTRRQFTPQRPKPTTFPQFARFPEDIRHIIWIQAIPAPRMIEIDYRCYIESKSKTTLNPLDRPDAKEGVIADQQDIPLLRTCRESRSVALKLYTLLCEHQLPYPIYLDRKRDFIVFKNQKALVEFVNCKGDIRASGLRELRLDQLYLDSEGLMEKTTTHVDTALNFGRRLDAWEAIGFACMRFGGIPQVWFLDPGSIRDGKYELACCSEATWPVLGSDSLNTGFASNWFRELWKSARDDYIAENGEDPLIPDLRDWKDCDSHGILLKHEFMDVVQDGEAEDVSPNRVPMVINVYCFQDGIPPKNDNGEQLKGVLDEVK